MVVHRLPSLIPVLLATIFCRGSYALVLHSNSSDNANSRETPCPNAEDIAPCICTYDIDNEVMDMDCSGVNDEQQLYDVFHAEEMIHIYGTLTITPCPLTTLSDDVFGEATFVVVFIRDGLLTSIGPNTFKNSTSTLRGLYLNHNQLTDFPFETVEEYSVLRALYLFDNPIKSFPATVHSETLYDFIMHNTFIRDIPAASLDLPELKVLHLADTAIDSIAKGVFMDLSDIRSIYMDNGILRNLESLQFSVTSPELFSILLNDNFIESVESDTFKGVQSGQIVLSNNKLTVLPEATWRSVLDAGVTIILEGNDLTCGCDIAWLVLEPSYHPQVPEAMCHNGQLIENLDSYFFENNC